MDPDVILANLRTLVREFNDAHDIDHPQRELVDSIVDLDEWLSGGGFLPRAWQREDSSDDGPRLCGCGARHDVHTDEDDGTSGQDRDSYTDDQDRETYS